MAPWKATAPVPSPSRDGRNRHRYLQALLKSGVSPPRAATAGIRLPDARFERGIYTNVTLAAPAADYNDSASNALFHLSEDAVHKLLTSLFVISSCLCRIALAQTGGTAPPPTAPEAAPKAPTAPAAAPTPLTTK